MVAGSSESWIYFYDALSQKTKRRILKISHYPKWTPKKIQNDVLEKWLNNSNKDCNKEK